MINGYINYCILLIDYSRAFGIGAILGTSENGLVGLGELWVAINFIKDNYFQLRAKVSIGFWDAYIKLIWEDLICA